jgi:phospholipase/carboxylesterase
MPNARKELQEALKTLAVRDDQLVLMGFSQGAMMAVDAAMRLESRPAGVAILSGTLVDQKTVATLALRKKGLPFFQSHGSVDPILGFAQALALERELQAVGWLGALHRFEGGHTIPEEILMRLGQWIDAL